MPVEILFQALLKQALSAIQLGKKLPPQLLRLSLLDNVSGEPPDSRFYHIVNDVVQKRLAFYRKMALIPAPSTTDTPEKQFAVLAHDFASGNDYLQAWSALYYRFLTPDPVNV